MYHPVLPLPPLGTFQIFMFNVGRWQVVTSTVIEHFHCCRKFYQNIPPCQTLSSFVEILLSGNLLSLYSLAFLSVVPYHPVLIVFKTWHQMSEFQLFSVSKLFPMGIQAPFKSENVVTHQFNIPKFAVSVREVLFFQQREGGEILRRYIPTPPACISQPQI